MGHILERYRYRILSALLLVSIVLFFYWVWIPLTSSAVSYLTNAASEVTAYRRTSDTAIPPDSLIIHYRLLSKRIEELGTIQAKPSDILQRILAISSDTQVVLQDMSTRDPITTAHWIEYPVNLRATGKSNAVLSFLAKLENGSLCVSIASIKMHPTTNGVEAAVSLSVFVPPEKGKL